MAVIQVDMTELSDVVDVLNDRGIQYAISYEPGVAYLYGNEDLVEQVEDILWARDVLDCCGAATFEQVDFLGAEKIEV